MAGRTVPLLKDSPNVRRGHPVPILEGVPNVRRMYVGDYPKKDLVLFENGGQGFAWMDSTVDTSEARLMGPGPTLALGLTELCAEHGHGKVYFMSKPFLPTIRQDNDWPNSYRDVPSLLYAPFGWSQRDKDEWFNTPVWQRQRSLKAQSAGVPSHMPVIPIGLYWSPSSDTLDNIRFLKPGLGSSILTYNQNGTMHLGFLQDLVNQATWLDMPPDSATRSCWQADLADVVAYRMRSGAQIAQTLDNMWGEMLLMKSVWENIAGTVNWVCAEVVTAITGDVKEECRSQWTSVVHDQDVSEDEAIERSLAAAPKDM